MTTRKTFMSKRVERVLFGADISARDEFIRVIRELVHETIQEEKYKRARKINPYNASISRVKSDRGSIA